MKLFLALVLFAVAFTVNAAALKGVQAVGDIMPNKTEVIRVAYDFSVDGGATGDYSILTASDNVLLKLIGSKVITAPVGAGATFDIGVGTTGQEFEAAGLVATYSLDSFIAGDSAPLIKLASGSVINFGVNTAVLTAGKIEFIFQVVKF